MKILIAGDWHSELHEEAVYQALQQLGHEPVRFSWHQYFKSSGMLGSIVRPLLKAQNKYMSGPVVNRLNRDLVALAEREQPDVIFAYRGTHIYPQTLRRLRQVAPNAVLIGYNNDDPYAAGHPSWLWRHFIAGIPFYDLVLAYRFHNLRDFKDAGAKRVELLRSWYIPERNHPVTLNDQELAQYGCDVVFIGHYEPDGRLEMLEQIVREGFDLRLYGPGYEWDRLLQRSDALRHLAPVRLVWGEEYNRAICGAKVALCFLSKLNRDTYTRRCFEIPATGTMMLAEYTDDLATLFREGCEADFFRDTGQLIERLRRYLGDDAFRQQVAAAGCDRVRRDGHDVVSRMQQMLAWVEPMLQQEAEAT